MKDDAVKIKEAKEKLEEFGLNPKDFQRALGYAKDLGYGLKILRTFSQGVTVFGSARFKEDGYYYQKARELGQLLAQNGHTVITGGGPGIMEAANRGAYEYGGHSIGFNIILDHEQKANPYLTKVLEFKYFFARKVMLTMASKVFVIFPGGFGSLDELSEVLCLVQTKKMPKVPIFLFGKKYWHDLEKFFKDKMVKAKLIEKADLDLLKITDDINEIVAAANEIGHFKIDDNIYDNHKN